MTARFSWARRSWVAAARQLAEVGWGIGAVFHLLLLGYTVWIYRREQQAYGAPLPVENRADRTG